MNNAEFISYLTRQQIQLFVEEGRLRYRAAADRAPGEEILAQIRQRRDELIEYLQGQTPRAADTDATGPYPLSQGQEALWFIYRLDPRGLAYNTFCAARLNGDVDHSALREALVALAARHGVLGTRFGDVEGSPAQRVTPDEPPSLAITDARGWSAEETERFIESLADQPFDLEAGPVARWHLLTGTGDGETEIPVLVFAVHHIVVDFRSLEILFRDLTLLYRARLRGETPELPSLPWAYRDYVRWSLDWPRTEAGQKARDYWLEQLGGELPVLDLPTDFERPQQQQYGGATLLSTLSPQLTARLRAFAREHLVTPYVVLLSALGILLRRYTGQSELLVGSPMLGRNREELGEMVGYFVNPVVLRLRFDGDPEGASFLSDVRRVVLEGLAHQDYPFPQLIEDLRTPRDPSRSPLFQVGFVYERESGAPVESQGLFEEVLRAGQRGSVFDLTLTALERGDDTMRLTWEFATALFRPSTVERMTLHFERLLSSLLTRPELPVGSLPLLSAAEEEQLRTWNETRAEYQAGQTLAELFAAQVASTPEAIAVEGFGGRLSYRELDERSSRLARHLQAAHRVGPNVPVGIMLPRSAELVVSVLAVLKAGGACLPLDPELPPERLGFMLGESAPPVLLTRAGWGAQLPPTGAKVLDLAAASELLTQGEATAPASSAAPDDLLYVLYTSGSTGQAKGVAMTHRPLVNLVAWQARQPGLDRPARTLQYTPLTFDVSFQELATTLCGGGTLVLIDEERRRDSNVLLTWLGEHRVERLFLPFVALQHLAESAAAHGLPPSLREVITAGEQLRITPAIRRAFEGTRCRLHNHYGPTESHVVTAHALPESVADWEELPPIGEPVSNVEIHLLDARLQPVPVGVPGELYVAGAALARGYLNRPGLTAERFLAHDGGGRLYRTGDLARRRADGAIEYVGRADNQIKLRGFRVELGEIEAVLSRHPSVREAAVVVRGDGDARRLAAYVAADAGETDELLQSLDAHLRQHLPGYMIPASVTLLERLPQTPSGKVDRRALPAPTREDEAESFVAPRTEAESFLAALWAALLELPRVGVNDNFFSLGGHSLLATRLVARVRDSFGVELPLRTLFDHPTVAALAQHLEREKGALTLPPLKALPEGVEPQPSFGQQRLWFLEQLEGPSATYNMPAGLALRGALDEAALRRSLLALVARHAALRLSFPASDGQPRARLLETYDALSVTDLSALDASEREREAERLSRAHAAQPFDLAEGPLLRLHLLRFDAETHRLLFNMHHIISDGWSLGVLLRELSALYETELQGGTAALPELSVRYADYAAWQRGWLKGEVLEQEVSYWRKQLEGAPPLLELRGDRPRPPRRSYRGGLWTQTLDAGLAEELRRFNLTNASTTFMTLLAGFKALLWRYTGQEDLVVGSPVANRSRSEVEGLVGFFVNTLALRTRVEPAEGFVSLLKGVRRACLDAYAHQDVPFEKLVEELQPERSLGHTPLFQVMLVMLNTPSAGLSLTGLVVETLPPPLTVAKFDLTLYVEEQAGGLRLVWEYNADIFEQERVARLAGHFEELLRSALERPSQPLAGLNMLTAGECRKLIAAGEGPRRALDWESVVEAVEAQARRTPHSPAVMCGAHSLDYRQLDGRANQLARYLKQRGVGRGDKVALFLPRSVDMLVGVLGVLKAGAAYLPLDPNYPAARVKFIIEDARAALLLSHSALEPQLPASDLTVCLLDREADSIAAQPTEPLPPQAGPDDLIYVIYTSGTTGQPKGSAVYHRGFANLLQWYVRALSLTDADRVLLISALGFDLTQKNLFTPLLVGGSLHLPAGEDYDPEAIAGTVAAQRITWLNCTPSTFYPLVESRELAELERLASLRWVVLGGEPIQTARLRRWLGSDGCAARVLNTYGPTECTDICAAWSFDGSSEEDPVPLGRPIENAEVAVLDAHFQPVPEGLPGELWIGGAGLGAGYLNRPELDAERFVEVDVLGRRRRMYRTGDHVRWRADGALDYLGRGDNQIKLRGFRIELGEIEAALLDLPAVREAVVAVQGVNGQQKLVGYYVAQQPGTPDALHAELQARLPAYMIPSQLVRLEELPRTPNGKLDRLALGALKLDAATTEADAEPGTATEERLAELWAALLGLARVERRADFFSLGGHSLLATQVIARIRDHFGCDLPLRALFEQPTVAGLAALIDAEQDYRLPPLTPQPEGAEPVLSFAQQRLCFLDQMDGRTAYNVPASLELLGPLDERAFSLALRHLVERHEGLRFCFPTQGGQPRARMLPLYDPLTRTDLSELQDPLAEAERLRAEHAARPFNLAEGPLFSLQLLRLEPQRHWLLFNMHHIITDGWSMDLLIRELAASYSDYRRGQEPSAEPLRIQYADFAAWQRRCIRGAELDEQLDYWRAQLADAPPRLELPTDFPRPLMLEHRGGEVPLVLDAKLTERLRSLAKTADSTLFMALLAAYNILLNRYSGQKDISVGTPVANRSHVELERVVGLFLNTLVLRTRMPRAATFNGLLAGIRRTTLAAYAHQDLPFEYLVEQLQPQRSLSHNPLFQVMLNLVNTRSEEVRLEGLDVRQLNAPQGLLSKFDLSLSFTENAAGGLDGRLEYNAELFTAETIEFLAECFVTLAGRIVERPDAPLAELSLLNADWRERVASVRRPKPSGVPVGFGSIEQSIPNRFAEQVRLHPERVALRTQGKTLNYRELDEAARALASVVVSLPPSPRVALLLQHDERMIVGLLGVLQAGRA
ncbi:MAG TPA: amino acid adenylation domain-containing protein, partial [Pyrinomonadaceae bacterium]|nr:amino acid adenylation domain-containing protein [Pyrinomonadaceae bacterium]